MEELRAKKAKQSTQQFKAIMKKNWIIWKRNKVCSCLELGVPIFFNLILLAIRAVVSKDDIPSTSYYEDPVVLNPDVVGSLPSQFVGQDLTDIWQNEEDFITYRKFLQSNSMKSCYCDTDSNWDNCFPGVAALAPKDNAIINEIDEKLQKLGIQTKQYDDNDAIDSWTRDDDYNDDGPLICMAVVLTKSSDNKYEYLLRFNTSMSDELVHPDQQRVNDVLEEDFDNSKKYFDTGFLTLQNWLDNAILKQETNNDQAYIKPSLASVKTADYIEDDFIDGVKNMVSFFTVLPLILILINFISKLLYEKEKKIKEGMKMMGMSNTSFYSSWIVTYLIIVFFLALLQAIVLKSVVLKHSDFFLIFIIYFLFGITQIAEGFFIQVFFSRVMIGMIISMVAFLVQYMLVTMAQDDDTSFKSKSTKIGFSFFPQVAVTMAITNMLNYEYGETGVKWSGLYDDFQRYNVAAALWMMILFAFILIILGLYLDQVFPNEFGTKKHPLFFLGFKKSEKLKSKVSQQQLDIESQSIQDNREEIDAQYQLQSEQNETVFVENLRKSFSNGTKAVRGVSFSMYKNEISVLLGHNGAGKTTTISMLTGLLDITGGKAQVFDKNVSTSMDEIRQVLGICPQHDILFDKLTVKEHLELFATFKGLESDKIEAEVTKMIKDLDLVEKTNSLSMTLSGGQKRRLSVGIAFIGDSKFVVLDEPTSGMDTSARRFIWDLLKNYKTGRIILLTTHFMDEADYLGDKITIMSAGKVKASGSSLFLKNRFGVGYNLVVVKKTQEKNYEIFETIKKLIPDAIQLSDVSSEITFQLPMESKNQFEKLFNYFDDNLDKLNIQTYGISITTLEEVFLKVAELESTKEKENEVKEFKEKLKKSMTESVRNKQANNNMALNSNNNVFDKTIEFNTSSLTLFNQHFWALIKKRLDAFKRDKKGLCCEIFLPSIMIIIGLQFMTQTFIGDPDYLKIEANMYDSTPLNFYYGNNSYANSIMSHFDSSDQNLYPESIDSLSALDDLLFEKKDKYTIGATLIQNVDSTNKQYDYFTLYNSIAPESSVLYLNLLNKAIISEATGKDIEITVYNAPLKITKQFENINSTISGMFASFYFSLAMAFIPASIIVFLMKEKIINAKHQQRVSGVTYFAYWFANLSIDYVKYLVPCIVAIIMAQAFDVTAVTDQNEKRYTCFVLLNILYGFSLCAFTYLFTFIFVNHGTAQLSTFFISLMVGTVLVTACFILKIIDSTKSFGKIIQWFFRFLPPFAYGNGLMNIANIEMYQLMDDDLQGASVFHADVALPDLLFLAFLGPILFIILLLIERAKTAKSVTKIFDASNAYEKYELEGKIDGDVKKEIKEIESNPAENYALKVDKLRKVYPNGYVGVKQISFGIQNGDCFSLLGVNGAGKTTTFKMLCGEHPSTSGDAYINGYSINDNLAQAQKIIGYCPQFDALLELLTVREHLVLYSNIKGIVKHQIPELVDEIIQEMSLKKFENICAGKLSGGNKRKLSVAIAMIGNPPIIFLDEPSTGMDPAARRFMWTVISRISTLRQKSAVVLTTHSMEEAEALSTKLGIMVAGEFKCMGSVQHIKNKFGKGYEIEVKLQVQQPEKIAAILEKIKETPKITLNTIEQCRDILRKLNKPEYCDLIRLQEAGSALYIQLNNSAGLPIEMLIEFFLIEKQGELVKEFLKKNFDKFTVIEHYGSYYRFKLDSNISVGKLFGKFEKEYQCLDIANYSIKQATIEQIFNLFAEGKMDVQEESEQNSQNHSSSSSKHKYIDNYVSSNGRLK